MRAPRSTVSSNVEENHLTSSIGTFLEELAVGELTEQRGSRLTDPEEFLLADWKSMRVCSSESSYSTGGLCHLTECRDQCSL